MKILLYVCFMMVGNTLQYDWGNVGGWLRQRWLKVGETLADGWGSFGGGWGHVG